MPFCRRVWGSPVTNEKHRFGPERVLSEQQATFQPRRGSCASKTISRMPRHEALSRVNRSQVC